MNVHDLRWREPPTAAHFVQAAVEREQAADQTPRDALFDIIAETSSTCGDSVTGDVLLTATRLITTTTWIR